MTLFSILFIALSLSMDSFTVAISNGILLNNTKILIGVKFGLFFGGFQFIMPVIGYFSSKLLGNKILVFDHWIAFLLLTLIGGKMIIETFKENEIEIKSDKRITSFKNLTILAIATSIDALAVGVSLYMMQINIWVSSFIIGVVAFILSFFGIIIGKKLGKLFSKNAERIGGGILIFIGIKILAEHLYK